MTDGAATGFRFTIHYDSLFLLCDDEEDRALATAFCFIKPEWVVTAEHAVLDMDIPHRNLSLLSRRNGRLRGSVLFLHPSHDLAVLGIEGQSPCDVPLFPSFEGYTGSNGLVACGYAPSLSDRERREYKVLANPVTSYERQERTRRTGEEALILFDAPWMEGGHSGGPVFGEGGGVAAVMIELIRSDNGVVRARATSILHLLRYLTFGDSGQTLPLR